MKIAIIGSGIGGLTAAWLLDRAGHNVSLFDRSSAPGMSAHGWPSPWPEIDRKIDVPARLFNSEQWPRLLELYRLLGVKFETANASQSFSIRGDRTYLSLDHDHRPQAFAATLLNGESRRILLEAKRLRKIGLASLRDDSVSDETFASFLDRNQFDDSFRTRFLFPVLSSTVCTCDYGALENYPAAIILSGLAGITEAKLLRTSAGTEDVATRLLRGDVDLRLNAKVSGVVQNSNSAEVRWQFIEQQFSRREEFDQVVIATQANHALQLLHRDSPEHACLSLVEYQELEIVVHRDKEFMPPSPGNWRTFNVISNESLTRSMCSVWLNDYYPEFPDQPPLIQTINPIGLPKREHTICRVRLQRPVVTRASQEVGSKLNVDPGKTRIWFCGSYASRGIPLLETAVESAIKVTEQLTNLTFEEMVRVGGQSLDEMKANL